MNSVRPALLIGLILVMLGTGAAIAASLGPSRPSTRATAQDHQEPEVVSSCRANFIGDVTASSQWHTPASPRTAELSQIERSSAGGWMVILSGGPKRLGYFCQEFFKGTRVLGGLDGPFPILLRNMLIRPVVDYANRRGQVGIFDVFVRTAARIVEVRGVAAGSKPVTARTRDGFAELVLDVPGRTHGAFLSYPMPIGELLGISSSGKVVATCGLSDEAIVCVQLDHLSSS